MAYASRQVAYPPPIFDISSNTAVARATAARDVFAPADAPLRPDVVGVYAARIAPITPVRATVALRGVATDVVLRVAVRDVTLDVAARDAVVVARRVALRVTDDVSPESVDTVRATLRVKSRVDVVADVPARGFGICSANAPPVHVTASANKQPVKKLNLRVDNLHLSFATLYHFSAL